jgi:spore maturation protein CgeB
MDAQRDYGMLNNRVFEVLASGVPLLTERFEALERTFPEDPNVVYVAARQHPGGGGGG